MYSITKFGKELNKSLYNIDKENKVFSSEENNLVLDFTAYNGWSFKTGSSCAFTTGSDCVFKTGYGCVFITASNCTFKTGFQCVFYTGSACKFNTGRDCTFKTGWYCTFKTGYGCTFTTGSDCVLLCHDNKIYRHFLDESNYVFAEDGLVEIKDENAAILNMKHENNFVRKLCREILKGGK